MWGMTHIPAETGIVFKQGLILCGVCDSFYVGYVSHVSDLHTSRSEDTRSSMQTHSYVEHDARAT